MFYHSHRNPSKILLLYCFKEFKKKNPHSPFLPIDLGEEGILPKAKRKEPTSPVCPYQNEGSLDQNAFDCHLTADALI